MWQDSPESCVISVVLEVLSVKHRESGRGLRTTVDGGKGGGQRKGSGTSIGIQATHPCCVRIALILCALHWHLPKNQFSGKCAKSKKKELGNHSTGS